MAIDDDEPKIEKTEDGGVTVEVDEFEDDSDESPFDLEAEADHLDAIDDKYGGAEIEIEEPEELEPEPVSRRPAARPGTVDTEGDDDLNDGYDETKGSDKTKKRIGTLTRRRKMAEAAAAQAGQQAAAERERADDAERKYQALAESYVDNAVGQTEQDIERYEGELEKAIEVADTKEQVRLTREITKAQSRLDMASMRRGARTEPEDDPDDEPAPPATKPAGQPPQAVQPGPEAVSWAQANEHWYRDPAYAYVHVAAKQIDGDMAEEQWPVDETYFQELERRLVERVPIAAELLEEADEPAPTRRRAPRRRGNGAPVAGVNAGNPARGSRKAGQIKLTPKDLHTIEYVWGEDPTNPKVLKAFADSRRETDEDFHSRGHRT